MRTGMVIEERTSDCDCDCKNKNKFSAFASEGYMDAEDFNNLTEGKKVGEFCSYEYDSVCYVCKKVYFWDRHLVVTQDKEDKVSVKMIVAAQGKSKPDFYFCEVKCTKDEYEKGNHYKMAEEAAKKVGYQSPMVAISENDPAGQLIAFGEKYHL